MLDVALKEWAVVCDLMLAGEQTILLRKGGVHERGGPGVFQLEYDRFAFWPSWDHQRPELLKPAFRDVAEDLDPPDHVEIAMIGVAEKLWRITSREAFDTLDDLHVWSSGQIDMRFSYKPDRPLYLLAVRVYRLRSLKVVPVRDEYAGCVSWVPLVDEDVVDEAGARPVMKDAEFEGVVARVGAAFE